MAYLWNAMAWWYTSGNGGDLGGRIARAIDDLRRTRREAIKRGSNGTLDYGDAPRWGSTPPPAIKQAIQPIV
jgi:hypothetical protein